MEKYIKHLVLVVLPKKIGVFTLILCWQLSYHWSLERSVFPGNAVYHLVEYQVETAKGMTSQHKFLVSLLMAIAVWSTLQWLGQFVEMEWLMSRHTSLEFRPSTKLFYHFLPQTLQFRVNYEQKQCFQLQIPMQLVSSIKMEIFIERNVSQNLGDNKTVCIVFSFLKEDSLFHGRNEPVITEPSGQSDLNHWNSSGVVVGTSVHFLLSALIRPSSWIANSWSSRVV